MKKIITYTIILLIVAIIAVSGTYALFTASITIDDLGDNGTHQIQVRYSGDTQINGFIELVEKKEEGFRRVIKIGKGEDSVPVTASIYIYLSNITEGFSSPALKWEIYEIKGDEEIYVNDGTFDGSENGDKIYLYKNFELSNEKDDNSTYKQTEYAIYLWLNGHEAGNEVVGASLMGYIGAESSIVTGDIN